MANVNPIELLYKLREVSIGLKYYEDVEVIEELIRVAKDSKRGTTEMDIAWYLIKNLFEWIEEVWCEGKIEDEDELKAFENLKKYKSALKDILNEFVDLLFEW